MNRNYVYLTLLMLLLAVGTLLVKTSREPRQIEPQVLLSEIIQPTRYVTTDQVAKMIIQGDPSLEIIDVRSPREFEQFSLPHSVNIPLDSLLTPASLQNFGIQGTRVVLIGNDDIAADNAWVLTKRLGYNHTYVMRGGLNHWMETIIDPKEPAEAEASTAFDTYQFRKGARIYFTGSKSEESAPLKMKVEVQRRKKSGGASGGC
jgi:rhodanese-related sulfurtransferase